MTTPRVLLCGDALGRLNQLFKRVQSVNDSSGPFDALLCVGQFFPDSPDRLEEFSDYLEGRSPVPIPTYFTGDYGVGAAKFLSAASRLHADRGFKTDGLRVCDKLYWLKGSGKFFLNGLCIAYLSGRRQSESQGFGLYTEDDVGALRVLAEETQIIDVFLTNEWPSGITRRADTSAALQGASDPSGCDPVISELAEEIKPRYHYAGTKCIFYAREPYLNEKAMHVTRFVGLAAVGNKEKQRFIHAISPTPANIMSPADLHAKPTGTTLSPYTVPGDNAPIKKENKRPGDSDLDTQFWRYDVSQKRQRQKSADGERLCFKFTSTGSCPRGAKCNFRHDMEAREQYLRNVCFDFLNKGECERGPDCKFKHSLSEGQETGGRVRQRSEKNCWFCLSSPTVESHLIISVGESYYCALAKGPLVEDHVLLVPVEHCPNTLSLALESDTELEGFKKALRMVFEKKGKAAVFYEFLFQRSSHANLQSIPVPLSRASIIQRAFNLAAKKLGFEFTVTKPESDYHGGRELLREQFDGKSSFFYVELPDGTTLSYTVEDQEKFPVQFGREVFAGLLNVADRADWRNCKLGKEEEMQMAEEFKKSFEEFGPAG